MDLYLVRHGKAEQGSDDDLRHLTEAGRSAAERLGEWLEALRIAPDRIEHGPLLRATETAECIASRVGSPLVETQDLRPEGDVAEVRERLAGERAACLMLVGHNPFMERLAGELIAGDADLSVLTFYAGSVAKLTSTLGGMGRRFSCDWLLTPKILDRRR